MAKLSVSLILIVFSSSFAFSEELEFFDILEKRVEQCLPHFNLQPFVMLAMTTGEELEGLDLETAQLIEQYYKTGTLPLTEVQSKNPQTVKCAIYAEGLLAGALSRQFGMGFLGAVSEELAEQLGDAALEAGKSVVGTVFDLEDQED